MKKEEDTLYLELALDEMQKLFSAQVAGLDSIKTNVRAVLSAASLIVSLVSALQILAVKIEPGYLWLHQSGIALAAVLYVALVSLCIMALLPVKVVNPLLADWDVLTTAYKGLTKKEAISVRLSAVLNAIDLNAPMVERFRKMQAGALILLPVLVVVLLLLTFNPKGIIYFTERKMDKTNVVFAGHAGITQIPVVLTRADGYQESFIIPFRLIENFDPSLKNTVNSADEDNSTPEISS